jgi:diacylglycerol kinase family enzyme
MRVTERPGHAAGIVREEARLGGDLKVFVLGGDGTLHEAVIGAAGFDNLSLTHIPCGTGNDFIRCFGGKDAFLDLERLIPSKRETRLDLMEVTLGGGGDKPPAFHAVNICSVGVDADVAAGVRRFKWAKRLGGSKMPYNLALVSAIAKGVKKTYTVTVDGERLEGKFTILTCCNGQTYGGGFHACPDADPADGALDFLLVWGMGRTTLLRIIGRYAAGRYKELTRYVRYQRGSSMTVESDRDFYINCDGEVYPANKVTFKLSPLKLRFILPE